MGQQARFLTPGVLYISSGVASEFRFLKPAFGRALQAGYTRFVEPACGAFAMCHLAQQAGWRGQQMEASDVTLFSAAMGYAIMGKTLDDLDVRIEGFEGCDLTDPATVLWAQAVARARVRSHQAYWAEIARSMLLRKDDHIAAIRASLDRAATLLSGLTYQSLDLFAHLDAVMDDPHTLVSLNPPSTGGGYEKFFDTGSAVSWKEPYYEMFDPVEGYKRLDGYMQSSRALLAIYEENQGSHQVQGAVVARGSGRKAPTDLGIARSINYYIVSNRPEEFKEYTGGMMVEAWTPYAIKRGQWPILPEDYPISPKMPVAIEPIPPEIAGYYRALWTHKFMGASAPRNLGVFLDGYLFGVLGYDPAYVTGLGRFGNQSALVEIHYGMTAPNGRWRLNRLLGRLALCSKTLARALSHVELYRCETLITAQLSPYPESKEYRGIMKLEKRKPDSVHGYRLIYRAPVSNLSWREVLKVWWEDEQRWRMRRSAENPPQ